MKFRHKQPPVPASPCDFYFGNDASMFATGFVINADGKASNSTLTTENGTTVCTLPNVPVQALAPFNNTTCNIITNEKNIPGTFTNSPQGPGPDSVRIWKCTSS